MKYINLSNEYTERFNKYIKCKFTENKYIYNMINEILNDNIVLTGSTVISAILTNPYFYNETRNIDINIIANIYDINYIKLLNILDYNLIIKKKNLNKCNTITDDYIIDWDIYNIIDTVNKKILQINLLHINIIPKEFIYHHKYNNLNIVKNYYNGSIISVLNYYNLKKKYDNICKIPDNENNYYNIIKYINRGFHISIFHIDIHTLYKYYKYPSINIFQIDVAKEIIRKYITVKKINLQKKYNIIYKKKI
jgi:hypothetical protein